MEQANAGLAGPGDASAPDKARVHRGAARLVVGALASLVIWDSDTQNPDIASATRPAARFLIAHAEDAYPSRSGGFATSAASSVKSSAS